MPPKKAPTGKKPSTTPTTDARFADELKQPRFAQKKASKAKEVIDDRFKDVMHDEDFQVKAFDKYNRVNKDVNKETMSKLYDTSGIDSKSNKTTKNIKAINAIASPSKSTPQTAPKRRLPPQSRDADSDEEDDESQDEDIGDDEASEGDVEIEDEADSTDIGTSGDEEDDLEDEGEVVPEGYTQGSIRGSLAPLIDNPTQRLALYNMEWDQLRAVDILAIFRSICAVGGTIPRVSVFPSEKGKIMLEREKRGDFTLWMDPKMDELIKSAKEAKLKQKEKAQRAKHFREVEENKGKSGGKNNNNNNNNSKKFKNKGHIKTDDITLSDSEDYLSDGEIDRLLFNHDEEDRKVVEQNRLRLQEYELNKLSYYYAIIECDSVDTALKLYNEADGLEYESSGNVFDLRFVPDGHVFDEKTLRDRATIVPPGYRPPVYQTSVLNQTKFECTWEREDPARTRLLRQDFSKGDYRVDDLTVFLANESDEEGFNTDVPISETDDSSDEVDEESEESEVSENCDEDDESASDDDTTPKTAAKKIKSDHLNDDRIVDHKVVDGKKKKVVLLKRRARNDFAAILAEIGTSPDGEEKSKEKKAKLQKANEANEQMSDFSDADENDGDDEERPAKASKKAQSAMGTDQDDIDGADSEDSEDEIAKRLAEIKRKLASKGDKKQKIVFSTGVHDSTKESERSLGMAQFREKRLKEWKNIVSSSKQTETETEQQQQQQQQQQPDIPTTKSKTAEPKQEVNESVKGKRSEIKKDVVEEPTKTTQKSSKTATVFPPAPATTTTTTTTTTTKTAKNTKKAAAGVVDSDGEADSDDYLDDDEFFASAKKEFFSEKEFGAIKFNNKKGSKMDDDSSDSDGQVDTRPAKSIQDAKKNIKSAQKRKLQTNNDDDNSSGDEGYTLTDLVRENKIKQIAIQNKKKTAKELEQDLINQSLGMDAFTTSQSTTLSTKDIKAAVYAVNKQNAKAKKKYIDAKDFASQQNVSLAAGGVVVGSDKFKVNVNDERFTALFDDADFGIDVNNPNFHNTEGTTQILAETQKRRQDKQQKQLEEIKKRKAGIATAPTKAPSKTGHVSSDVTSLIGKIKAVAVARKQK